MSCGRIASSSCATGLAFCLLASPAPALAQCEVAVLRASDASTWDSFGRSVSMNADFVVVGAPQDSGVELSSGSVYVFRRVGMNWTEEAKLIAEDPSRSAFFGTSVSIFDDIIAVGARNFGPSSARSAYVFRHVGVNWVQEAKLTADEQQFGSSVAVTSQFVVVGAPESFIPGSVYVYRHDGMAWVLDARFSASDSQGRDQFGHSVSILGDVIAVGAYATESAYVFRHDGESWVEETKLAGSDAGGPWSFGYSVAINSELIVVGTSVSAYVYRFDGSSWLEEAELMPADSVEDGPLSVSTSGDIVLLGALGDDHAGFRSGSAYVFRRDGTDWVQAAKLVATDAGAYEQFGITTSCSEGYAVVGAWQDDSATFAAGAAYLFRILGGADCNANGTNDACEFGDCNGNSTLDECDIAAGTSEDCSNNGIPDECEPDCNGNEEADSCDIMAGTSDDCNTNGTPDECEPDCNENGIADSCDIAEATSGDCNGNGIPDECEPDEDCNVNGTQDICDLARGTSQDCNQNAVLDECDIATGTSEDVDGDGLPDECPFFALVPVPPPPSVGPYPPGVHIIDREIFLPPGGGRLWLEVAVAGWGPDLLCEWQATIDSWGYGSGSGEPVAPAVEACDDADNPPHATCEAAFGPASTCDNASCTAGFQDFGRSDFVIHSAIPFVDTSAPDYFYGSFQCLGPWCFCTGDEGHIYYGGTLVLDVPPDAQGSYTIGFVSDPDRTFIHISSEPSPAMAYGSARITVCSTDGPSLCCMPSGACTPLDPVCCQAARGVIVQSDLVCGGDGDRDGVDSVCGDGCPDDPDKTEPGVCGCGVPEDPIDIDGDGVADYCGAIPTVSEWGLVVLGLLLLAAATICIVRPQQSQQQSRARS